MKALEVVRNGICYAVVGRQLVVSRGRITLARLDLCPRARESARIGEFRREGERIWAPLGGPAEGRAVLEARGGFMSYTVETSQPHFDTLTYFPSSELAGDLWHTFIWAQRDRAWDRWEDVTVRVGEARPDNVDTREGPIADPGEFPSYWPGRGGPRVCAAHSPELGWWGLCIPGPLPVCNTSFVMEKGRFGILFDYLHPGCDGGFMPTVYFTIPLADSGDPYSIFGPLWELSAPWRLVAGRDFEPSRFAGLALCHPWEAMQQAAGNAFTSPIPPARLGSPMNSEFLLSLLSELAAIEPSVKWQFQLPQGWFRNIGDFAIGENFGGEAGFRDLAGRFRAGGHLLTVHERFHRFNERSEVGGRHPDWVARLRPGRPKPYWSANEAEEGPTEIMDVTREEVREHLKGQVRRFLSDAPGCLDMDGFHPTGDNWPSMLDYELAHENYGVGDLLAYKLNRELFLYGKSIKPYALIQGQGIEGVQVPLYGMSQGMCTMEDHLPVPIHTVQQLRLITSLLPSAELHIASYCTTRTKALVVWPLSVAIGRPEIDNPRAFTNAFLTADWIPMTEPYRRRMAAVLAAYANCPRSRDQINLPVRVEGDGLRLEVHGGRRHTAGRLAGFYSALSLGSRTVVTYSETRAVVVSTVAKTVIVPLPPNAAIEGVAAIAHSGQRSDHDYSLERGCAWASTRETVRLHVPDSGGETKLIEIRYRLAPNHLAPGHPAPDHPAEA